MTNNYQPANGGDSIEVLMARMETELRHLVAQQVASQVSAEKHRGEIDRLLSELNVRITRLEQQLVGGKAFAHGFRYAIYLMWCLLGSAATYAISALVGAK